MRNIIPGRRRPEYPTSASEDAVSQLEKRFIQELTIQPYVPVMEVIDSLLKGIEELYPGAICSILKLSPEHTLLHYSAPSLPSTYTQAINGGKPGPQAGSCGTAVHYNKVVIVSDIETDPLWKDIKNLALPHGLRSCWSIPIYYSNGKILGTFAVYHLHRNEPNNEMISVFERLTRLTGLVIENREMIENLRISTERYNLSSMATHDMVWDWDLRKKEIYRNEVGLKNIYGFFTNDPIKNVDAWVNRIHPEDREKVAEEINSISKGKKNSRFEVEYRFLRGDGVFVFIYDRGYILRDAAGDAIRVIGAAQDITDRVNSQRLMQESEERYRYLFQSNPLSMWIFEVETGRFLEVNQTAVQQYGYSLEEFYAMTISDIQHKDGVHRKKDGELIYVEIINHELQYKGRDAVLVLANDITQNIRLQEQLLEEKVSRQKEITRATVEAQEKERVGIGHELHDNVNQILTSAKLYLDCLGLYDEKREEYRLTGIELIVKAVEEIRRISKSMSPPRLHDVGLIRSIADLLTNLMAVSSIQADFSYDHFDEDAYDDELKLTIYRIVQEQITNVIKHADANHFSILFEEVERKLVVSLQDNGKGYEPSSARKGIGINNMINRAALHNGEVHIESAPGQGFILHVVFPLSP